MWVSGQRHAPAALPPGKTRYPLCRRLSGPQARCGRERKISPPPGIDPRTAQPVASRYTECEIPALCNDNICDPNLRATQSLQAVGTKDMLGVGYVNRTNTTPPSN